MRNRITCFALALIILAGLFFYPGYAAWANSNALTNLLNTLNLPPSRGDLEARLDRGQLVYGLPTQVPGNDWKEAGTSWQDDNGLDVGHSGNQEPRYLGYTADGLNLFTNDWFPNDAPDQIAPAVRNIVENPWDSLFCSENTDTISDYTWGVIQKTLQTYHERIGFETEENSFTNNPAFQGDFGKVKDYFKVLSEPRPGLAGAVRHWHNRDGGVYYDTITVRWDIIPDFIIENIDPGTEKAEAGKTYTGKVLLRARPDTSFLSDPLTSQLFDAMGYKQEFTQDYAVPFGVAVNGQLVPIKNLQALPGMNNIYQYNIRAGKAEDTLEFAFDWTAGASPITIAAGVNTTLQVLPVDAQNFMDWSEIVSVNNTKSLEVPIDLCNFKAVSLDLGVPPGQKAEPGVEYTATVTYENEHDKAYTDVPVAVLHGQYQATLYDENGQALPKKNINGKEVQVADFGKKGTPESKRTFTLKWHVFNQPVDGLTGYINHVTIGKVYPESTDQDNVIERKTPVNFQNLRVEITGYPAEVTEGDPAGVTARVFNESGEMLVTKVVWKVNGEVVKIIDNFDILNQADTAVTFTMPGNDANVEIEVNPDHNMPGPEAKWEDNVASCFITTVAPPQAREGDIQVTIHAPGRVEPYKYWDFSVEVSGYFPPKSKEYAGTATVTLSVSGQSRNVAYRLSGGTWGDPIVTEEHPANFSDGSSFTVDRGEDFSVKKSFTFPASSGYPGVDYPIRLYAEADGLTYSGSDTKAVMIYRDVMQPELKLTQ